MHGRGPVSSFRGCFPRWPDGWVQAESSEVSHLLQPEKKTISRIKNTLKSSLKVGVWLEKCSR